jgi:hypothetical protein
MTVTRKQSNSWLRNLSLMMIGGSMLLMAMVLLNVAQGKSGLWEAIGNFFASKPAPQPEVDVRSVVIQQIQDASELTTAIFTMEAVVPAQQDSQIIGFKVGSTKLLYIAYGQVRAGVDLSQIQATDIQSQGNQLFIRLPAPKLLDSKIDVSRSSVYDYNRGFLGLGPDVAPNLQSLAQQKALDKVVEAACRESILQRASDRAKLAVSQLVKIPNYQVFVDIAPIGNCQAPSPTGQTQIAPAPLVAPAPAVQPAQPVAPNPAPIPAPVPAPAGSQLIPVR